MIPAYTFDLEERLAANGIKGRLLSRLLPSSITRRSTALLMEAAKTSKPDFVIIIKGVYISPDAIQQLRTQGIIVINYNPDHPIHFDSIASGNTNIRQALIHYHLIYTYSEEIRKEVLQYALGANVKVLPFGFEPSEYNSNDLRQSRRINKVCFVGTADAARKKVIEAILKAGFRIDVYGCGYESLRKVHQNHLQIQAPVFGNTYNSVLQSYDAQLNIFRRQNHNAHNMRTFEIPAVGGIQVSEYSEQCASFFTPGKEIFMYEDESTLMNTLEQLVSQSDASNLECRDAARKRCLNADYSYKERARQLLSDLHAL